MGWTRDKCKGCRTPSFEDWSSTPLPSVTMGPMAASMINDLLAQPVSLGGQPSLGRFLVVSYSFHFPLMENDDGVRGLKCGILFSNLTLNLSTTLSVTYLVCPLFFMMPFIYKYSTKNPETLTKQLYLH
ncbi:hypothetical protein ILYODFUR_001586 [Ilyodon furcidens]|uniref:Uncharacterized protein n=1 Tax=Ilyodon furcidens TaxID=33524 RepID=A0ABV0V0G1_9TELE